MAKFKITDQYLYWWPVKVEVPSERNSGKLDTQAFEVQFRALPSDEVQRITDEIAAITDPKERAAREHETLVEAVKDWRDVEDDNGNEVNFSEENLRALLRWPFVRTGFYRAYSASISGDKNRLGN